MIYADKMSDLIGQCKIYFNGMSTLGKMSIIALILLSAIVFYTAKEERLRMKTNGYGFIFSTSSIPFATIWIIYGSCEASAYLGIENIYGASIIFLPIEALCLIIGILKSLKESLIIGLPVGVLRFFILGIPIYLLSLLIANVVAFVIGTIFIIALAYVIINFA
ncbi:MAG: hypothetical protein J6B69_03700 [Lachnospiraceae bacterium]|nr:hypothetical protein [Lachnospiraceae bacterium]